MTAVLGVDGHWTQGGVPGASIGPRKAPGLLPQSADTEPARPADAGRARMRALFARLRLARRLTARLSVTRRRRAVLLVVAFLPPALLLFPAVWLVHHVYFDRGGVPNLEPFIRFETTR